MSRHDVAGAFTARARPCLRAILALLLALAAPTAAAPTAAAPSGIAPSGIAPSGIAPSGIAPSGIAPGSPLQSAAPCPSLPADLAPDQSLPHLAAALRPGGTLAILAIGSASTAAAPGYLAALRAALAAARPDLSLRIAVSAGRGEDAANGLRRLSAALAASRYDLVLWQTGTVDAVRGVRPDDLADTLTTGAALIARDGASLVLIDPQFSRFLRANADLEPYETVLRAAALFPDTALFPRTRLMRDWADRDGLDPERAETGAAERAAAARAQICVGEALARFLLAAGPADPAHPR